VTRRKYARIVGCSGEMVGRGVEKLEETRLINVQKGKTNGGVRDPLKALMGRTPAESVPALMYNSPVIPYGEGVNGLKHQWMQRDLSVLWHPLYPDERSARPCR